MFGKPKPNVMPVYTDETGIPEDGADVAESVEELEAQQRHRERRGPQSRLRAAMEQEEQRFHRAFEAAKRHCTVCQGSVHVYNPLTKRYERCACIAAVFQE